MNKQHKWLVLLTFTLATGLSMATCLNIKEYVDAIESNQVDLRISQVLEHPDLQGASIGISVRDASDGKVIYMHNGDSRFRPASSMKLVTSAVALQLLGENYRFSTEIYTDSLKIGSTLMGNVYVRGKGDPTLREEDIKGLVQALKKKGIKKVKGDLIADDTWYDDNRLSVDMPWSDEQEYYGAQISGLTVSPNTDYDAGSLLLQVKPGKSIGESATITLIPQTDYVSIKNKTTVGKVDSKNTIKVARKHGSNRITITGNIPTNSKTTSKRISVWNPTYYTLHLFKKSFEEQGIKITGKYKSGTVPAISRKLATDYSPDLGSILVPYMKLSNNTISEVLVKEIGRVKGKKGSWDQGISLIEEELANLGIDKDFILMRDGSGLSHVNMISANTLTNLLYNVQFKSWYDVYKKALPVAGQTDKNVGGTLRNRMKGTPAQGKVIAKTGTLATVSSLTGYVQGKHGNIYIFSVIINNAKEELQLKDIEDQLAIILADN